MGFFNIDEVHPSWFGFFSCDEVAAQLFSIEESIGEEYYPNSNKVLRFTGNDLDRVRHVIVGMDPYPSWNDVIGCPQATGRSFEVSEIIGKGWDYKIKQSSLRNILKAIYFNETGEKPSLNDIRSEIEKGSFEIADPGEWFDAMEAQGVLFMNSTLTVAPETPGSHKKIWQPFREMLVPYMSGRGISWHLWGKDAQGEYGELLPDGERILKACHPRLAAFVEENTFAKAEDVNWLGLLPGK